MRLPRLPRYAGLALYAALLAPWLLTGDPDWAGVAGGVMVLTIPLLVLRGTLLFLGDLRALRGRGRDR